jgi:hypothetical protein
MRLREMPWLGVEHRAVRRFVPCCCQDRWRGNSRTREAAGPGQFEVCLGYPTGEGSVRIGGFLKLCCRRVVGTPLGRENGVTRRVAKEKSPKLEWVALRDRSTDLHVHSLAAAVGGEKESCRWNASAARAST